MNLSALLADLRRRGVQLQAVGGRVRCHAARGTPELVEAIRKHKAGILATLALEPAHRAMEEAVAEIARRWCALPPDLRPDLGEEEWRLEEAMNRAFQSRDLEAAMRAVGDWRSAWERLLPLDPPPAGGAP